MIALYVEYKLSASRGKSLENFDHPHVVSLTNRLIKSSLNQNGLSIGFQCIRDKRQIELSSSFANRNIKNDVGNICVWTFLTETFGLVEHQENTTYGLGHNLIWERNTENDAINRDAATGNAKLPIKGVKWFVQPYTPKTPQ